ncbi:MAG TPA: cell wall-binding repeat-containing protein, partial [Nitriliruptorales bacterium]
MNRVRPTVTFVAGLLVAGVLVPAVAATVPDARDVPRVAVVARGDDPVDALASGPVAAAAGGVVVLTPRTELTAPAEQALKDFEPDLVILAGGESALSKGVFDAVDAAGPWDTRRVSGETRYETAAALAAVLSEFGIDGLDVSDAVPADDRTTYVQAGPAADANGDALRAAVAGVPTIEPGDPPWRIEVQAGTYDLGTSPLVLPDRVHLVGAGRDQTILLVENPGSTPDTDAAALVTGSGNSIEHLGVSNTDRSGSVVVGIHANGSIVLVDVEAGQNTNVGGEVPDSYGLVAAGSFRISDSSLLGFSGGTG